MFMYVDAYSGVQIVKKAFLISSWYQHFYFRTIKLSYPVFDFF